MWLEQDRGSTVAFTFHNYDTTTARLIQFLTRIYCCVNASQAVSGGIWVTTVCNFHSGPESQKRRADNMSTLNCSNDLFLSLRTSGYEASYRLVGPGPQEPVEFRDLLLLLLLLLYDATRK